MNENTLSSTRLSTGEMAALADSGDYPSINDGLPDEFQTEANMFDHYQSLRAQGQFIRENFLDPFIGEMPIIPIES